MEPLTAVLGIAFVFIALASWIAYNDGLTFLSPKSTRAMRASAERFCVQRCRVAGECPLNGSERAADCPLFQYIAADVRA